MAGYFIDGCHLDSHGKNEFVHTLHVDTPNIIGHITSLTQSRVLTLQVDGDELNAVMWGLAKFNKAEHTAELKAMYEVARLYAMANRPSH